MIGKTTGYLEFPSIFKILHLNYLVVLGITQNCPLIFFRLAIFQVLNFIDFGTWTLSENKVHLATFKQVKFKNVHSNTTPMIRF